MVLTSGEPHSDSFRKKLQRIFHSLSHRQSVNTQLTHPPFLCLAGWLQFWLALFSSLSRRSLGGRIEELWRQRISNKFEFFWLAVWKQGNAERKSKCSRGLLARKYETAVTSERLHVIMEEGMEDLAENSHNFSRLNTFHASTLGAAVTKRLFLVDIFVGRSSKQARNCRS